MGSRLEKTIGLEDVVVIHDNVISESGGISGLSGNKSLEGSLFRIDNRIFYDDLEDPIEIGAWYCVAVARGHNFTDGNKRTAFITMTTYFELNKIKINISESDEELANFLENIAEGNIDHTQVVNWLRGKLDT